MDDLPTMGAAIISGSWRTDHSGGAARWLVHPARVLHVAEVRLDGAGQNHPALPAGKDLHKEKGA